MSKAKHVIVDMDTEFDDVSFDEHSVIRYTAMKRVNGAKTEETHSKKSSAMLEKYSDPEYRTYKADIQQQISKSHNWKDAHAKGMEKRNANGWEQKNLAAGMRRRKAIQTPYGLFASKKEAVDGMTAAGVINASGKLSVWINTKSEEYYYV
jgi:hypothetical protein